MTPSYGTNGSDVLEALTSADERLPASLCRRLAAAGFAPERYAELAPDLFRWLSATIDQAEGYRDACERLRSDVIRLRGQRDALRQALLRRTHEDPMQGHTSEHLLNAIVEKPRPNDVSPSKD